MCIKIIPFLMYLILFIFLHLNGILLWFRIGGMILIKLQKIQKTRLNMKASELCQVCKVMGSYQE